MHFLQNIYYVFFTTLLRYCNIYKRLTKSITRYLLIAKVLEILQKYILTKLGKYVYNGFKGFYNVVQNAQCKNFRYTYKYFTSSNWLKPVVLLTQNDKNLLDKYSHQRKEYYFTSNCKYTDVL